MSYAESRTTPPDTVPSTAARPAAARPAPEDDTGPRWLRTFSALKFPHFRYLVAANTLQFASMQMQLVVRGALVYELTSSFTALGLVSLAHAIPGLVLTPFGGIIADRAPKRTVVAVAQALNMVNSWVLAALAFGGVLTFPHLVISATLQGGVNAVLMPTKQALTPDVVPRGRLMNAIALITSGQNLMTVLGPGLGGLLLVWVGASSAFVVMGALYAIALVFTARLPARPVYDIDGATAGRVAESTEPRLRLRAVMLRGLADMVDGVRYVAKDPTLRTVISVNFVVIFIAMPYTMMLPGFVADVLHKGKAEFGYLVMVSGIGALGGSLMVATLSDRKRGRLLILTGVILGGSLLAFAVSTNYLITLPIMLILGFGQAMRMSIGQVLVQSYSADQYRGRVMSVWMMQYSVMSIGTYGVGVLSEVFGPQQAIGGMALLLIALMAVVWVTVPLMRRIE